jgi:CheY-like chemotaxis protein
MGRCFSSSSADEVRVDLRILLIDDDVPSAEALRELLDRAGHSVVCARNGREALDRLRETGGFCVILLDVMMPVMDGFEFREEQLKDPSFASIPVIVLTAHGHAGEQTKRLQSERFFPKPFSPPELLRAIRDYCPPQERVPSRGTPIGR